MGILFELKRDPYPPPDRFQISQKVLTWLETNHLKVMEDAKEAQLADDWMVGWDVGQESEREHLGLMVSSGQGDPEARDEFRRLSLMRGTELWDMTIACAKSLQSKHANQQSLEGQDLLSYIEKLMLPLSDTVPDQANDQLAVVPHLSRSQLRQAKKRKRQIESHFFENPVDDENAGPPNKKVKKAAKKAEKKADKKRNRKVKREQLRKGDEGHITTLPISPVPTVPVLQEAASWYQNINNIGTAEDSKSEHTEVLTSEGVMKKKKKKAKKLKGNHS